MFLLFSPDRESSLDVFATPWIPRNRVRNATRSSYRLCKPRARNSPFFSLSSLSLFSPSTSIGAVMLVQLVTETIAQLARLGGRLCMCISRNLCSRRIPQARSIMCRTLRYIQEKERKIKGRKREAYSSSSEEPGTSFPACPLCFMSVHFFPLSVQSDSKATNKMTKLDRSRNCHTQASFIFCALRQHSRDPVTAS